MKILIASPYLPWPLTDGGRVAQYRTFEALRDACTFTLVVPVYNLEQEADAKYFASKFSNIKVEAVRCFQISPPPTLRTHLRKVVLGLSRCIFPAPKVPLSLAPVPAENNPWYPFGCLNSDFVTAVEKHLAQGCDIFQAEFADMMTLGPLMAGRIPTLLVHHQLHFVCVRRFMETNKAINCNARYLAERMIREEYAYLSTFDSVIVFSEVDRQALKDFCPSLEVDISPFPSPEDLAFVPSLFDRPVKHFVFVASEAHQPNVDGLGWFMKEVWPTIKQRVPNAIIEVIGKWSPAAQVSLPHYGDIRFAGFVPELGKALREKIMIVPVWVGSGIRTKILAAWSAACPVVTTSVGVEGLPGQANKHFVVADEASMFAENCIELSQNIDQLNQLATNGLELVKQDYSLETVAATRLEIYEKLLAGHRLSGS